MGTITTSELGALPHRRASVAAWLAGHLMLVGACAWMTGGAEERHAVLAPGQDALIGRMLGKDEVLHACRFTGGVADGATVRAFYRCAAGDLEIEVVHRDAASWRMTRTAHLGLRVRQGSAPDEFMTALIARLRAHEAELRWSWIGEPREGRGWVQVLIVLGVLAIAACALRVQPSFRDVLAAAGLVLAGTVAAILLLEGVLRIDGVERRLIAPALFLQHHDVPVHRVSSDPFLHYEMAPSTEIAFGRSPDGRHYRVTIDAFGARGSGHARAKAANTFRILCFGGSTMYGASVNDDETIPARLQAHLNRPAFAPAGTTNFEVWNFGTCAYTLGQAAHLAHQRLMDLEPDLIIVQHHNVGRRPFLATVDPDAGDPPALRQLHADFYLEQFPVPDWVSTGVNARLLAYSKLYRVSLATLTLMQQRASWPCQRCDEISAAKARALSRAAEGRGVPVLFVAIPADGGRYRAQSIFPELSSERFIDLFKPDREPAYYEVHPPAHTLDEWAAALAQTLRQRRLLDVPPAP